MFKKLILLGSFFFLHAQASTGELQLTPDSKKSEQDGYLAEGLMNALTPARLFSTLITLAIKTPLVRPIINFLRAHLFKS